MVRVEIKRSKEERRGAGVQEITPDVQHTAGRRSRKWPTCGPKWHILETCNPIPEVWSKYEHPAPAFVDCNCVGEAPFGTLECWDESEEFQMEVVNGCK